MAKSVKKGLGSLTNKLRKSKTRTKKQTLLNLEAVDDQLYILEFNESGESRVLDMSNVDLFMYVNDAVQDSLSIMARPGSGFPELSARDIRKLNNSFLNPAEPSIVVRQMVVLMDLDPFRAVVMRDRCLLLISAGADDLLSVIQDNIQSTHVLQFDKHGHRHHIDFEFYAYETVLESVIHNLDSDISKIETSVVPVLTALRKAPSSTLLEALRVQKNAIAALSLRVSGTHHAVSRLLDDDQDLYLLHLSKFWAHPELFDDLERFDHDEAEILFESYLSDLDRVQRQLALLEKDISNTEEIVSLQMITKRNMLQLFDVAMVLAILGLTIATACGAIFGSNLNSHVQTREYAFETVNAIYIFVIIGTVVGGLLLYRYFEII